MDKMESGSKNRSIIRILVPRLFKASVKTVIIYIFFAVFSVFMIPIASILNYQAIFTVFFASYLFFVFIIELTKNTIFQHIFSIANSLIIVVYFAYVLDTGIINFTLEQINLIVDLRFFLALFILGGLLGFAKSMLQLLNWMNKKEEQWLASASN